MFCRVQIEALCRPQQCLSAELEKSWQTVSVTQLHTDQSLTNFVLEIVRHRLLETMSIDTKQCQTNHASQWQGMVCPEELSCAGLALGSITDRGRGNIMRFDVDTLYNNVALGLLTTVSALRTFGVHRVVFYREAASGLNK